MRQPRWHHRWFLLGTIKVVDKIDGFSLDVLQQAVGGERLQPGFGVSHRGRWIVIHGTKVAMAVDQRRAHRKALGHAHQGVVYGRVAMGMVFTEHFTHHTSAFAVGPIAG